MQIMKWDDMKLLLAIARNETLSAAARALGVNQTTVARRLEALESGLETRFFSRSATGLHPTAIGERALDHALRAEQEMLAVEKLALHSEAAESGVVRISTLDGLIADVLMPRLADFRATCPDIRLELIASMGNVSLSRREADIALRLNRPAQDLAVTRKVAELGFAVYGRRDQPAEALPWLAYDEMMAHLPEARAAIAMMAGEAPVLATNYPRALRQAVRQGLGRAMLGCYVGDADPALVRLNGPDPVVRRPLWLMVHPEVRHSARVARVVDWLDDIWRHDGGRLAG